MKNLNIPSAMVGLMFGLIATAFVYLLVPPPSTASAASCPTIGEIESAVYYNCAQSCATKSEVKKLVRRYCS